MNVAALLMPFVVALPPGAIAPPPGAVPRAAQITVLDRELGFVAIRLPKRGVAASLRRLRAAPGVRFVEADAPLKLAADGDNCVLSSEKQTLDQNWRDTIHLSRRSAAGMLIGIADSGVDDDRLAPRQPPLTFVGAGGPEKPGDSFGHGTAVASLLVANRPETGVGVVGLVPDATLLSARIVRPPRNCGQSVLAAGLLSSLGWLRKQGAQVVNISATARSSQALVESLRALELSGALVVAAVGNGGSVAARDAFPASEPGVLGVGALAAHSSTKVYKLSSRGPQVDLVAPAQGLKVIASSERARTSETTITSDGTSFSTPLVTAAAAMVWATHRDWTAAEVANALVRSAQPLSARGRPSRDWGWGTLDVRAALRTARLPDPHEPNDWAAAARGQRPLHPGAVVVASLGFAGDAVDAYTVDAPRGKRTRAVLRKGGSGLALRVLPIGANDATVRAVAGSRPGAAQVVLPAGRSLVVVARAQGAGPYRLALVR